MPEYLAPGVYVEETSFRSKTIEGVSTSTTGFVGPALTGPLATGEDPLPLLTSFNEFEAVYGGVDDVTIDGAPGPNYLALAVRAFFDEGGKRLYVARTPDSPSPDDYSAALARLAAIPDISLVAAPGAAARPGFAEAVGDALVAHAEAPGAYRFAILDPPPNLAPLEVRDLRTRWDSARAALIYPWLIMPNPLATTENGRPARLAAPPSGSICGLYARNDIERAVWKAPANLALRAIVGLQRDVRRSEQAVLNPAGVNVVRWFDGRGIRLWGARTLSSDPEAKYVSVSRYRTYLAASLDRGLQWAVMEPNGEPLWAKVRQAVGDFLYGQWRDGALLGAKPEDAYFVRCDRSTMTQNDLDLGRIVCLFGVAAIKPAEFVIARVSQKTADAGA